MPRPNCIVVEGPDGSGKSTLLANLEKALGFPVLHTGGASADRDQVLARCQEVKELSEAHFVMFDRVSQISEIAYGFLRGQEVVSQIEMMKALLELRPLVIYCRRRDGGAESAILKTDKLHKPQSFLWKVLQNYPTIVGRYDEFMGAVEIMSRAGSNMWFIEYDWTAEVGGEEALIEKIKQILEAE